MEHRSKIQKHLVKISIRYYYQVKFIFKNLNCSDSQATLSSADTTITLQSDQSSKSDESGSAAKVDLKYWDEEASANQTESEPAITTSALQDSLLKMKTKADLEEAECADKERHILLEFVLALWHVVVSHTDIICYALVFLNQVRMTSTQM